MEVRDPIHGAIQLSVDETAIVDHVFVQRLRHIRQTGFSHLPFPGATHSRYSHCLGTAHLAGKAFDNAFMDWSFSSPQKRAAYRAVVRIAALCHDLGHAPFSHCTEFAMPPVGDLGINWYGPSVDPLQRATHEDYTIAILDRSSLSQLIERHFPFSARSVAALISHDVQLDDDFFIDSDRDLRQVLSQIISSELDVDRLDYLPRDSYYTGARYGTVDVPWLLGSLTAMTLGGRVRLVLDHRAIYAFDDFLIARHHMFLMVYFHHKSVVCEELLKRHVLSDQCDWRLPSDLETYLFSDDIWLEGELRRSSCPWARRLVEGNYYRRVIERHGTPDAIDLSQEERRLREAGIDTIASGSTGKLSRYNVFGQKRARADALWVVERLPGMPVERTVPLSEVSGVFQRYADARRIARLYVAPEQMDEARRVLAR